jgi:hypothetical protein
MHVRTISLCTHRGGVPASLEPWDLATIVYPGTEPVRAIVLLEATKSTIGPVPRGTSRSCYGGPLAPCWHASCYAGKSENRPHVEAVPWRV